MTDPHIDEWAGCRDHPRGPSVQASHGGYLHILDLRPGELPVEVIAHHLSNIVRFTGACSHPGYTVAEHCVHVSVLVPPEYALEGLFHDAAETIIGDINKPLKMVFEQEAPGVLSGIEDRLTESIFREHGLTWPMPPEVKHADMVALATEKRDFMPPSAEWKGLPPPGRDRLYARGPARAKQQFLQRFDNIVRGS